MATKREAAVVGVCAIVALSLIPSLRGVNLPMTLLLFLAALSIGGISLGQVVFGGLTEIAYDESRIRLKFGLRSVTIPRSEFEGFEPERLADRFIAWRETKGGSYAYAVGKLDAGTRQQVLEAMRKIPGGLPTE